MSKSAKSKLQSKSTKPTPTNERFHLLPEFNGDKVPDLPAQFTCDFRLLRQMVRWAKRYGVMREGHLHIYGSRQDMAKNKAWRRIDLAKSLVSYRNSDRKIIVNTTDPAEIFRMRIDDAKKYKDWVSHLRAHRQYGQAKAAPIKTEAPAAHICETAMPPPPEPTPVLSAEMKHEIEVVDGMLDKLEAMMHTDSSKVADVRNAQIDFLNAAKAVQLKLHCLLGIKNEKLITKWQPIAKSSASAHPTKTISHPSPLPQAPKIAPKPALTPPIHAAPPTPAPAPVTITHSTKPPVKAQLPKEMKPAALVPSVHSAPSSAPPSGTTSSGFASPISTAVGSGTSGQASPVVRIEEGEEQPIDDVPDVENDNESEKEEAPSLSKVPVYRDKLPVVMGPQPSVFRIAMSAIGRDVMQFSLPATIMEPLSLLQVMCEELEYSELIDQAVELSDPKMRMAYVACFACSRYGSTAFRSGRKPFNPLLGQTFEYRSPHLGWRFLGEQVHHHPSVSAGCAEGRGWTWWQDCELKVTFGGNSMEISPVGVVYLCLEKWKETYKWSKVQSTVSGLLSGSWTLDHHGGMTIQCAKSHLTAKVQFKKATHEKRGEIEGKVLDEQGNMIETIYGSWADSFYVGAPDDTNTHCVWRLAALPPDSAKYYGYTRFAMSLNEIRPEIHGNLPKTDSRFRPDQKALEMGRPNDAENIKKDLEERQRKRRKEIEAGKRKPHKPLWFQPTGNTDPLKGARWQFNGTYWSAKEKNFKGVAFLPLW